jgi:hypothetical protein
VNGGLCERETWLAVSRLSREEIVTGAKRLVLVVTARGGTNGAVKGSIYGFDGE